MRFWIGKELEGRYKGIKTLFVESSIIDLPLIYKIKEISEVHNFGQIYFGAGELDVVSIEREAETEFGFLKNEYLLTIETHKQRDIYKKYFHHVILSFFVEQEEDTEYTFKIRTEKNVYCVSKENCFTTNLSKLENGLFIGTDVEIK